jgi:hypothetical protein
MRWCTVDGFTVTAFGAGVPGVFIVPEPELEDDELLEPEDEPPDELEEDEEPEELPDDPLDVDASMLSPPEELELDVPPESKPDELLVPELELSDVPPGVPPDFDAPHPAPAAATPRSTRLRERRSMMLLLMDVRPRIDGSADVEIARCAHASDDAAADGPVSHSGASGIADPSWR